MVEKTNVSRARTMMMDWHDIPDLPSWPKISRDEKQDADDDHSFTCNNQLPETDFKTVESQSIDVLIGGEIMYTNSKQHRTSLARTVNYYLKPGGIMYIVQSVNREGMKLFLELITSTYHYSVDVRPLALNDPLCSNLKEKRIKAGEFVQREEHYVFYTLQKPTMPPRDNQRHTLQLPNLPEVQMCLDIDAIQQQSTSVNDSQHLPLVNPDLVHKMLSTVLSTAQSQRVDVN